MGACSGSEEARKSSNFFSAAKKRATSPFQSSGAESRHVCFPSAVDSAQSNRSPRCENVCRRARFLADRETSKRFRRASKRFAAAIGDGGHGVAKQLARGIG